jgi:hypothetical protein
MISASWQSKTVWSGSAVIASATKLAADGLNQFAQAHDAFLSARDPTVTLRVAATLWGLAVLGKVFR